MLNRTIGFIGAGQMARALASGFINANLVKPSNVVASDAYASATAAFVEAVKGTTAAGSNRELVAAADVVVLSVKPQNMATVMADIRPDLNADKLVISIAAGCTLATLMDGLGTDRIIRVMPNTPCLIGSGACAFAAAAGVTDDDTAATKQLLESVGYATAVSEPLLDTVTGLSGSGPAYVYQVIEALSDGGVRMGLPRDVATMLAAQTVKGAAEMVLQTGEHPAVLKDKVASPGGTTIAGLQALEAAGMRSAMIAAVEAATLRSRELGEN